MPPLGVSGWREKTGFFWEVEISSEDTGRELGLRTHYELQLIESLLSNYDLVLILLD